MKAVELASPGFAGIRFAERPSVPLGGHEVRIAMRAAALNYRDLAIAKGNYPVRLPVIPCSDGVGIVTETSTKTTRVAVGDRVCPIFFPRWLAGAFDPKEFTRDLGGAIDGVLAQEVVMSEQSVVKVPAHLTDAQAATLPCAALTAWSALTSHVSIRPGSRVLIEGTGGVSLFALQFALLMGAEVLVTSSSAEKLAKVRAMGAHHVLNYRDVPGWGIAAREMLSGGADVIVDVGGAATLSEAMQALAPNGSLSLVGLLSGAEARLPVPVFMAGGMHAHGIAVGSREGFVAMNRAIALHKLAPVIDRVFAFDDTPAAYTYAAAAHFGKVVIEIGK
jgi:NADPH:quinone reductase-like Zn-dependent oxidoreductase